MKMDKAKTKVQANSPRDVYKKIKPIEMKKSPGQTKNIESKRMSHVQVNFANKQLLKDEDSPTRPQLIKQVNQSDL